MRAIDVKISTGHTHTHTPTENNTPDPDTDTHDKNNTPNPQTNTPHKHFTTLEGGATTVRATSHARVGGHSCEIRPLGKMSRPLSRRTIAMQILPAGTSFQYKLALQSRVRARARARAGVAMAMVVYM